MTVQNLEVISGLQGERKKKPDVSHCLAEACAVCSSDCFLSSSSAGFFAASCSAADVETRAALNKRREDFHIQLDTRTRVHTPPPTHTHTHATLDS
jgi:hypothetical protein